MKPNEFLEKLSTHVRNAIASSISVATSLSHESVEPIHLLYGLLSETGSIASDILTKAGLEKKSLYSYLSSLPQIKPHSTSHGLSTTTTLPELSPGSKRSLEKAILCAYERSHNYVGTEHLMYGLIEILDTKIESYFDKKTNIHKEDILGHVEISLQGTSRFPDMDDMDDVMNELQQLSEESTPKTEIAKQKNKKTKRGNKKHSTALEVFARDLTDKYNQAKIDPVIGREKEIERIINILSRRTKNNPVLVGEPGVGKTAIVEGLAKRIVNGDIPESLKRKRILSLDLTLMIAGTIYRGEFEARLKQVVEEVEHQPNVILFIDELHNIIGAGSNQGAMDAANILKPALARGDLRCIGATTLDEYKKYISGDPALERRFQSIDIEEPSKEDTKKILQGIKELYEDFHNATITEKAIDAAVELSTRYIHDTYLPDKAIDLIDEAAASIKVTIKPSTLQQKYYKQQDKLNEYQEKKEDAIDAENFDEATKWKEKTLAQEKKLEQLKKQIKQEKKPRRKKVTEKEIAKILGKKLSIDEKLLLASEWEKLETIQKQIKQNIIGQDHVVDNIVKILRQSHLGFKKPNQPLASFLFVGPSGVGKTTLAKQLAQELYQSEKALIRLDMSEFAEAHGISKLLGSPAGYIGHNNRNRFTEEMKKRPYSVVLFDEIDKAHADVQKLLLQILDEGMLTDSQGKKIHFNHSILIMTTNTGADLFRSHSIGFGSSKNEKDEKMQKERNNTINQKLKKELGTALMSRIQSSCIFQPLSCEHIEEIINKQIQKINEHIQETNSLVITPDKDLIKILAKETFNEDTGARHVDTTVNNIIHELIVDLLEKKNKKKKNYTLKKIADKYTLV